jgi:hypothetical protein
MMKRLKLITKVLSHPSHYVLSFQLIQQTINCTQNSFLADDPTTIIKKLCEIEKADIDVEILPMVSTDFPLNPSN